MERSELNELQQLPDTLPRFKPKPRIREEEILTKCKNVQLYFTQFNLFHLLSIPTTVVGKFYYPLLQFRISS